MNDQKVGNPQRARFLALCRSLRPARRECARLFQRKRLMMVNVDELIARDEPTLAAAKDQDLAEIREALFKIPKKYREPLVMQVLMGFSTAEIAAGLELPHAEVLTRLFRGRRQLRALCGEDTDSDPPGLDPSPQTEAHE